MNHWITDTAVKHALAHDGRWRPLPPPGGDPVDETGLVRFVCAADAQTFISYLGRAHGIRAAVVSTPPGGRPAARA